MPRRAAALVAVLTAMAVLGPWLAPYEPARSFPGFRHAPPMPVRFKEGFVVYPLLRGSLMDESFFEDRTRTVALPWSARRTDPVFLLGTDISARDVLSRLLAGARVSIGVGLVSMLLAALLGASLGGWAASRGGWADHLVMRLADFVLVLPMLYVVLMLRGALPLVLAPWTVFALLVAIFGVIGAPYIARTVRSIVAREREREYVLAARSLGASRGAVLWRHLLPACGAQVAVQSSLLLPAFILAEATLSYIGLGFADPMPTWGTMLHQAAGVTELSRFPWTLASSVGIFAVTLVTNLMLQVRPDDRRWHQRLPSARQD